MIKKTRVAIYVRVSATEQAAAKYSIDEQIETIRTACELQGKEVVSIYMDNGISGKDTKDRFALEKMLEDSSKNIFDEVMVLKIGRLARNILDFLQITNTLSKNDVTFRSLSEPCDTSTPQGRLMINMLSGFAELESAIRIDNLN